MQLEVNLPYFKRGDDLSFFLQDNKKDALKNHAKMLRGAAAYLEELDGILNGRGDINADCHFIWLDVDEELGKEILEKCDFVSKFYDEEEV